MSTDQTTDQTLWCVHIPGPDDLYASASLDDAKIHADKINAATRRYFERNPRTENDPTEGSMTAVVIPWPWDADSHASDIAMRAEMEAKKNARSPND